MSQHEADRTGPAAHWHRLQVHQGRCPLTLLDRHRCLAALGPPPVSHHTAQARWQRQAAHAALAAPNACAVLNPSWTCPPYGRDGLARAQDDLVGLPAAGLRSARGRGVPRHRLRLARHARDTCDISSIDNQTGFSKRECISVWIMLTTNLNVVERWK